MHIAVIGAGYVGLTVGVCLAESGLSVSLIELDEDRVWVLERGELPFYESGLTDLYVRNFQAGHIGCTTSYSRGLDGVTAAFLAVGTPPLADGSADLSRARAAITEIAKYAPEHLVLVIKSTVPVGTAAEMRQLLDKAARGDIEVVSNPEFLRQGQAVEDFLHPDRVVIGADSGEAARLVKQLYQRFLDSDVPVLVMDNASAEMAKYASNAFLAARVSYVNEIANICDHIGVSVDDVVKAMGADHRIGSQYLQPGCGYGGSCLAKDLQALMATARAGGYAATLLDAVAQTNEDQKRLLCRKIHQHFEGVLEGRTIAIWGLAFKEKTDDVRESPAIALIDYLIGQHAHVQVFDPVALPQVVDVLDDRITECSDKYQAVDDADALVVMTPWSEFRQPDWDRVKSLLRVPVVFDGRNLYDPAELVGMGFTYVGFGRPQVTRLPSGSLYGPHTQMVANK